MAKTGPSEDTLRPKNGYCTLFNNTSEISRPTRTPGIFRRVHPILAIQLSEVCSIKFNPRGRPKQRQRQRQRQHNTKVYQHFRPLTTTRRKTTHIIPTMCQGEGYAQGLRVGARS